MKSLGIGMCLFLHSVICNAEGLQVSDLSLEYIQFFQGGRSPLVTSNGIPDKELGQSIGLNLTVELLGTAFWENHVTGVTDHDRVVGDGQFRSVGWEFNFGVHIFSQADLYYHHHSQHVLDHQGPFAYPVEDGIGLRLKLIGGGK